MTAMPELSLSTKGFEPRGIADVDYAEVVFAAVRFQPQFTIGSLRRSHNCSPPLGGVHHS